MEPSKSGNSRFVSTQVSPEDRLKEESVGLVQLSDFRKRRAEVAGGHSDSTTPKDSSPQPAKKKIKKAKGKLSFATEEDDEEIKTKLAPKLGPNSSLAAPKALTKSALAKEAEVKSKLRQEFLELQEAVKATEMAIPFVFYDGSIIPGGVCRVKKGDHVWFFLDKARKVGAEMGVNASESRKGWARISVDDLMLVRGDIIIPHHYDFYYFMVNKSKGFNGLLFDYSPEKTSATPILVSEEVDSDYDPLNPKKKGPTKQIAIEELEGFKKDAELVKVVDRRWYEKNKHIYPATLWEEFDAAKDYTKGQRKDTSGNGLFF